MEKSWIISILDCDEVWISNIECFVIFDKILRKQITYWSKKILQLIRNMFSQFWAIEKKIITNIRQYSIFKLRVIPKWDTKDQIFFSKYIEFCNLLKHWIIISISFFKVRIFWEGHKIWKDLPLKIWRYSVASNFKWKIFSNLVAFSEYPNFNKNTSSCGSDRITFLARGWTQSWKVSEI